jgi:hypothetical protein
MSNQEWPQKPCKRCGKPVRFVKTKSGWQVFELRVFKAHRCKSRDAYDHPDKLVPFAIHAKGVLRNDTYAKAQLTEQPVVGLFEELLAGVKPALEAADREWQHVKANEAPDFRALSLVGPDENCLSDILAELLDPRASHGHKAKYS